MKSLWFAPASLLLVAAFCATSASAEPAKESKGAKLFVKYRCTTCHSVKSEGIEKKATEGDATAAEVAKSAHKPPDLSGIGKTHEAAWFAMWLQKKETVDGRYHKIKFRGTDAELKTRTEWVESLKTGGPEKAAKEEAKPAETKPEESKAAPETGK